MALFIDIGDLSEPQTDRALNQIYKAIHNHGDDEAIWDVHPSPFVRRLVELFTQRGLMRLDGFRAELNQWIEGVKHKPVGTVPDRPAGAMARWTEAERQLVKIYLEALPPGSWTLDDNMLMVDFLVQRYLPADDLRTEAEWLATRSTLMGKVQASMEDIDAKQADTVLAALPSTVASATEFLPLTEQQVNVMRYGVARAAENVVRLTDDVRHRMRNVIMRHTAEQMLAGHGEFPRPSSSLQTKLSDEFATLNRDWRRIAVTEATENLNQGYVASQPPGTKIKRVEQYRNACAFCRKIDGKIVTVVEPDAPEKDGENEVWVGKTNIGRSAAPRKRIGGILVEREPEERWWIPAGAAHPHCRGRWVPTIQDRPGDDADFGEWLRATLGKKNEPAAD